MGHVTDWVLAASRSRRALAAAGLLAWLGLAAGWSLYLWRHQTTPGVMAEAPAEWPAASRLTRDPERYTLLAFAHPRCPCVRATLEELREIEARYSERVRVVVISCAPAEGASDGFQTLMADIARAAPRTEIFQDLDQAEALRFGARTSGTIMLFRPDGRLAFDGGITAGRGHVGPNPGAANVIHALEVGDSGTRAPVFGCPLGIVREGQ